MNFVYDSNFNKNIMMYKYVCFYVTMLILRCIVAELLMKLTPKCVKLIFNIFYLVGRLELDCGPVIDLVLGLEELDSSSGARLSSRLSRSLSRLHHQLVLHAVQVQAPVGGNVAEVQSHFLLSVLSKKERVLKCHLDCYCRWVVLTIQY